MPGPERARMGGDCSADRDDGLDGRLFAEFPARRFRKTRAIVLRQTNVNVSYRVQAPAKPSSVEVARAR